MHLGAPRPRLVARTLCRAVLCTITLASLLGASAGAASALHLWAVPYASATAGNVEVTLPSAYPDVQLSEVGNQSENSALSIDQILESTASVTSPQIVAVALPSDVVVTNGTGDAGGLLFGVTAALTVYPSNAGLWQGPGDLVQADGAPVGTAHLSINYSVAPSMNPSHIVTTQWSVSGWPWASSSDLLGVQLSLSTPLAQSVVACTGSTSSALSAGCPGTILTLTQSVWSSGVSGLQGNIPHGPTALVGWDSGFTSSSGSNLPVTVGALSTSPSVGHLVLAAPGEGSSRVSGDVSFSLLPPVAALASPLLVHGVIGWYLGGIALSSVAALVGLMAFRSRQRSAEREL